ncbi:hypothetical protein [Sansalvadorimonas verongulae]|uniref:hypothetical protein n=1 Tax=Sansalvadorimonas verongulae TaxID=2172824 RepID=UPI0012BC48A1|nr:hypothetical protein [Sansalvadorimonas verongulae]MTI13360.1 hypothetical protein [Sansalvadorimonas verongulae]
MSIKHHRQVIREAVAAQLLNKTDAGDRVFVNRQRTLRKQDLPCLLVYTTTENCDTAYATSTAPRVDRRRLSCVVDIRAERRKGLDDLLDTLAAQVEQAVFADVSFSETVADSLLTSTRLLFSDEGEDCIGSCELTWELEYYTDASPSPDDLPYWDKAGVSINTSGGEDSHQEINVPGGGQS